MVDLRMILHTYVFFVKNEHIQMEMVRQIFFEYDSIREARIRVVFFFGGGKVMPGKFTPS